MRAQGSPWGGDPTSPTAICDWNTVVHIGAPRTTLQVRRRSMMGEGRWTHQVRRRSMMGEERWTTLRVRRRSMMGRGGGRTEPPYHEGNDVEEDPSSAT